MLTDPQSITISGTAIPLPRTSSGLNQGEYTSADGNVVETFKHTYGKRTRRTMHLRHSKIAPDPLISAQNIRHSSSVYFTVDLPDTGYTPAELKAVVDGMIAQLSASSGALITKMLGGEN